VEWFDGLQSAILRLSRGTKPTTREKHPMHELLVALSLAAFAFIPCVVSMDETTCEIEETA